jgi:hypothetical protein
MKKIFTTLLVIGLFSLGALAQEHYGAKITPEGAKAATELPALMKKKKEMNIKITGQVLEACKVKGCWMMVDLGNGQKMRVSFKDYAFFVPKNSGGKTAVMEGVATWQETTVKELKHYAKDAGKSQEEIDAIKKPKKELVFEASGVILM